MMHIDILIISYKSIIFFVKNLLKMIKMKNKKFLLLRNKYFI